MTLPVCQHFFEKKCGALLCFLWPQREKLPKPQDEHCRMMPASDIYPPYGMPPCRLPHKVVFGAVLLPNRRKSTQSTALSATFFAQCPKFTQKWQGYFCIWLILLSARCKYLRKGCQRQATTPREGRMIADLAVLYTGFAHK